MNFDGHHAHMRRAVAGIMNMLRISIAVTKIAALMVPRLKGKLKGITFLVPIPNEFILYVVLRKTKTTYKDTMNAELKTSIESPLTNVLAYIGDLFVSFDFKGTHASSAVEGKLSMVIGGDMVEVVLKYNEN